VAGNRTVPIELGDTYLSENSASKLLTLKNFIEKYIEKNEDHDNNIEKFFTNFIIIIITVLLLLYYYYLDFFR
jgi:hypothetical protein